MEETILSKDTINVTIHDDHNFDCSIVTIGRAGENDITQLEITLPEELKGFWAYLDFKKPNGEKCKTERLEIINNIIEYNVPDGLLDKTGNLEVQLVLQSEKGEIWKSNIRKFVVLGSIDATEDIPFQEDFITRAQTMLDDIKNKNINVANALITTKSGNKVILDDVSPIEHDLKIRLSSDTLTDFSNVNVTCRPINLLPFPYNGEISHPDEAEIIIDNTGKITFAGTIPPSRFMKVNVYEGEPLINSGVIFWGNKSLSGLSGAILYFDIYDQKNKKIYTARANIGTTLSINLDEYPTATKWHMYVYTSNPTTFDIGVNNVVEPFISDNNNNIETVTVPSSKDGIVTGIKSPTESMELVVDTFNVNIECEYNKDINAKQEVLVDSLLLPDSENPVQNKTLFEILTVPNTAKKTSKENELIITDGINAQYPLIVNVAQTEISYEIGANKINYKTISNGWLQNTGIDIIIPVGKEAILSFDIMGNRESFGTMDLLTSGEWSFEPELEQVPILHAGGDRYYIEIKGHNREIHYIAHGFTNWSDTETYLDNCALRFDGSTEYEAYTQTPKLYDLTEVTVTETNSGQTAKANADGTVNGLYAMGENINLVISNYNDVCELSATYRRSIVNELIALKTLLISSVSTLNTELASLTDIE